MSHLARDDGETQSEARPADSNDTGTHETDIQPAARTEAAFSCRRWYRLTGKSIRPDDELTHILPSMRFASTAPARPQNSNWTKTRGSETQIFSHASPRDRTRFNGAHSSTHQGIYGMVSPPMPSKWSSNGIHFDARNMQQLATRVYTTKANTVKRRKEQEKKALKQHIYLPAVEKTLKMFHSPRSNAFAEDIPPEYESGKSIELRPTAKAKHAAPIGANLLSSQVKTLQEELTQQTAQEASELRGKSGVSSPAFWSPQPPRTAANASYRSLRFTQPPRNDPAIQGSLGSSDNGNWATSSLLFSKSASSQQEISKFHIVVPGDGDSRNSASSLETHVLGVLGGCDRDSSRQCSSDDLRFGLESEDDDDLTLLQAIESATLKERDELCHEKSVSEVPQPTPPVDDTSQDPSSEAAECNDLKPEQSEPETPNTPADEAGQENIPRRGEAVRAELPHAIQDCENHEEISSALAGEACVKNDGCPASLTSHSAHGAIERNEKPLRSETTAENTHTMDDPGVADDSTHGLWSADADDVTAMSHGTDKLCEIDPGPVVLDEASSGAMTDDVSEERHKDQAARDEDSSRERVKNDFSSKLSDPTPNDPLSSSVMIHNEEGIQLRPSLSDMLPSLEAIPVTADNAVEDAAQGDSLVFSAEIVPSSVELAYVSSTVEASVNAGALETDSYHDENKTAADEDVADNEPTQSLPDSPVLSELEVIVRSQKATPAEKEISQHFLPSLQDLVQQIASDTSPPDDSETTPAPETSGPQPGNDYEADFEDSEDEENEGDAQDDPKYCGFKDES